MVNRATAVVVIASWIGIGGLLPSALGEDERPSLSRTTRAMDQAVGVGACCIDGVCHPGMTQDECEVVNCGDWGGDGSLCLDPPICPAVALGVCCVDQVCREDLGADACECANGVWVSSTDDCAEVECSDYTGRCCYGADCYEDYTEAECLAICGVWGGAGTDCSGPIFPCPLTFGACCIGETCLGALGQFTCECEGGIWHPGASCVLNEQTDCNNNGIIDVCEVFDDCNSNGIPDECEPDCNENGIPDECDIADCAPDDPACQDCNENGVPDGCEPDCNGNEIADECDIADCAPDDPACQDCNENGVPDGCEPDCNGNEIADECDIADCAPDDFACQDCDENGVPDACDIADCDPEDPACQDCNENGVPDGCEPDCNENGVADECDISSGTSSDLNANGIPDECEADCNGNGLPDDMDISPGNLGKVVSVTHDPPRTIPDCGGSGEPLLEDTLVVDFPGECEAIQYLTVSLEITHSWVGDLVVQLESPAGTIVTLMSRVGLDETSPYCDGGECCGENGPNVDVQLADHITYAGIEQATDLTGNFHPDAGATAYPGELQSFIGEPECGTWTLRIYDGAHYDTGSLVSWSLSFQTPPFSEDHNGNGIPDECEPYHDCNGNGIPDEEDIANCDPGDPACQDCNSNGMPDECDLSGFGGLFVGCYTSQNVIEFNAGTGSLVGPFFPSGSGGLEQTFGLVFGPNGNLLVGDIAMDGVWQYDGATGAALGVFVQSGAGGLDYPGDLNIGPNGNLFVLNYITGSVYQYDGWSGQSLGLFCEPSEEGTAFGMAFGPNDNLYVSSFLTGEVLEYDGTTGELLGPFTQNGGLTDPVGLAFGGPDNNLFVSDPTANRIEEYDGATGEYIGVFIDDIGGDVMIFLPQLEWGPNGHLYMSHSFANAVAEYDQDGTFIQVLPASPDLVFPTNLTFRPPSNDCNTNGVPDECEDCNGNRLADECDIDSGYSEDLNGNGIPDECEGPDVKLALVVRLTDGGIDSATTLPESDLLIHRGQRFYVELWGTDRGPLNTGLEHVYATMSFEPGVSSADLIDYRPPFTTDNSGWVDNAAGKVYQVGGRDAAASGVGIEPQWVRIAVVRFAARQCATQTKFDLMPSLLGVAAVDRGLLPPSTVSLGTTVAVDLIVSCIYDLDHSGVVDVDDLNEFASHWLSAPGDPNWDARCDFDCSNFVDAGDLGWLIGAWLLPCDDLTDDMVPECRRCANYSPSVGNEAGM